MKLNAYHFQIHVGGISFLKSNANWEFFSVFNFRGVSSLEVKFISLLGENDGYSVCQIEKFVLDIWVFNKYPLTYSLPSW